MLGVVGLVLAVPPAVRCGRCLVTNPGQSIVEQMARRVEVENSSGNAQDGAIGGSYGTSEGI